MKIIFILFSLTLMNLTFAGERVGNGEGFGEQRVNTVNEYLPSYIEFCVQGGCMMTIAEIEYARQISGARFFKPKFSYLSGKTNPGTFETSGLAGLFKTTTVEDSAVVVNLDRLYLTTDKEINAITLEEALGVVLEIYNYKLDDGFSVSELFVKKLAKAMTQYISTTQHSFDHNYIKLSLFKMVDVYQRSLFVSDQLLSVNISAVIKDHLKCNKKPAEKVSFVFASWHLSDTKFALVVEGDWECEEVLAPYKLLLELNMKRMPEQYPGALIKVKLIEEPAIRLVVDHSFFSVPLFFSDLSIGGI